MNIELKIKASSLAAEARIIRKMASVLQKKRGRALAYAIEQEFLAKYPDKAVSARAYADAARIQRLSIQDHRRGVVRTEARATHLARAFIGGMPYKRVEAKCWTPPEWDKVVAMVKKYMAPDQDNRPIADRVKEWREVA